jgi:prolyl oligopeptidase
MLHGVELRDPYRNLEEVAKPETRAWLEAQGAFAAAELSRIPGRAAMARRIEALATAAGDSVRQIMRMPGGRIYYLERKAGEAQYKLKLRQGLQGRVRVLVDPEQLARATGVPHAINYYRPAWDGRTLAYGISAGGSEDASLHLMDIASGRASARPSRGCTRTWCTGPPTAAP